MTLKEKIAELLYEDANNGAWEVWADLSGSDKDAYLELADDILNTISNHLGIR